MEEEKLLTPRQRRFLEDNADATMSPTPRGDPLVGVSGWLAFLVVSLIILGPLATILLTAGQLSDTENLYPEVTGTSLWRDAQIISWASAGAFCLISIYAGLRLWKSFVRTTIWIVIACLWVAGPLLSIGSLLALEQMGGEANAGDFGAATARPFIWAFIWTLYLLISRRVKKTYPSERHPEGGRSNAFRPSRRTRQLIFFGGCWLLLSFLYFQLIAPVGDYPEEGQVKHMWGIIVLPPLLFALGSWAYGSFVGSDD